MTRHEHRPRRAVSHRLITALGPLLRYSPSRDAWVMRFVGQSLGPVLVKRPQQR